MGNTLFLREDNSEFKKDFERGVSFSYLIFFASILFLVSWYFGFSNESMHVQGSNLYSKTFFFLNPNIFIRQFFKGYAVSDLQSAVSPEAFTFISCYLLTFLIFATIVFFALRLFLISYRTCIRPFHYISCLSLFPIINCFIIFPFIYKLTVHRLQIKFNRKKLSYEKEFTPEIFEDPKLSKDLKDSYLRPVTENFSLNHYKKVFKDKENTDFLEIIYKRLTSYLA